MYEKKKQITCTQVFNPFIPFFVEEPLAAIFLGHWLGRSKTLTELYLSDSCVDLAFLNSTPFSFSQP